MGLTTDQFRPGSNKFLMPIHLQSVAYNCKRTNSDYAQAFITESYYLTPRVLHLTY